MDMNDSLPIPSIAIVASAQPRVRQLGADSVRQFAGWNCRIEVVTTAREALDFAALTESSLVLIDHLLADVDGLNLVREITKARPQAVCLFLYEVGEQNAASLALRSGAFDTVLVEELSAPLLGRIWRQAWRERAIRAEAVAQVGRLQRENTEVNHLMRALSHDLRANMMMLGDSIDQMKRQREDTSSRTTANEAEYVDACLQQSRRLLDDLADLAKTGQVDMRPQAVNVEHAARNVVQQQRELMRRRGIVARVHQGLPTVWCHPDRLSQLLTNLIRNAALHGCAKSGGRIDILPLAGGDANTATFAVCDNGGGIPAEFAESVFAPGQRLDSNAAGTGMGLAIVRRIAEHFGGSVRLDTGFQGGARIVVCLPRPIRSSANASVFFDSQDSPSPTTSRRSPRRAKN